eukprot:gene25612-11329_t
MSAMVTRMVNIAIVGKITPPKHTNFALQMILPLTYKDFQHETDKRLLMMKEGWANTYGDFWRVTDLRLEEEAIAIQKEEEQVL